MKAQGFRLKVYIVKQIAMNLPLLDSCIGKGNIYPEYKWERVHNIDR